MDVREKQSPTRTHPRPLFAWRDGGCPEGVGPSRTHPRPLFARRLPFALGAPRLPFAPNAFSSPVHAVGKALANPNAPPSPVRVVARWRAPRGCRSQARQARSRLSLAADGRTAP